MYHIASRFSHGRLQEFSKASQVIARDGGSVCHSHHTADASIEHPLRHFPALAMILARKMTLKNGSISANYRSIDDHFFAEPRMPWIDDLRPGNMGVRLSSCTTTSVATKGLSDGRRGMCINRAFRRSRDRANWGFCSAPFAALTPLHIRPHFRNQILP